MIKKKSIVILFVTAFLFIFSQAAFAQEVGKLGVGARVSYMDMAGDTVKGNDLDFDRAAFYGIDLTYFFCNYFSLEASLNNDFDLSSAALSPAHLEAGATADIDNSFGYHVNGGIEWFLSQNIALNCDLKYIWNSTDMEVKVPGEPVTKLDDIDLNAFVAGIGINYYF